MNVVNVLADLRAYKTQLDAAIAAFDRLARRRGEKRGRPLGSPAKPAKRKSAPRKSKPA